MVIPWKSPFSAPCPVLFPATPRSSVLSFLLKFPPYSFPQNSQKNSFVLPQCCPLQQVKPSAPLPCCHLLRSLPQPPFLHHYNAVTSNNLCSSHLSYTTPSTATFPSLSSAPPNGLRDPLPESSSTCQSSIAASKSEVDSLWPLRM